MAAAIGPSATVRVVEGAGHACHLQRPAEVAEALVAFLGEGPTSP
jgi:pimeloyl-ACP methyl ester carboxylesterase